MASLQSKIQVLLINAFRNKDNVHLVASCEFVSHTVMLSTVCIEQVSQFVGLGLCVIVYCASVCGCNCKRNCVIICMPLCVLDLCVHVHKCVMIICCQARPGDLLWG